VDRLRDDVRTFRIDRITTVRTLREEFRLSRADACHTAGVADARTV
jgi:predicted DNA-binding transcriptional regulator YafY